MFLFAKNERYYYDADSVREPNVEPPRVRPHDKKYGDLYASGEKWARTKIGLATAKFNPAGRNRRTVWSIGTVPFKDAHFATMPEKLVEPCILSSSRPGDIVLDPFSGAATVPLVASKLGRHYIGIELNPEYINMSHTRLAQLPLHAEAVAV